MMKLPGAALFALCTPLLAFGGENPSNFDLDRPVVGGLVSGQFNVWGQYDAFRPGLNLVNYQPSTTSTLDKVDNLHIGAGLGLGSGFQLRYAYEVSKQNATRLTEPKKIDSSIQGHDIRLQYKLDDRGSVKLALEGGYRSHKADPQNIYRYSGINVIPAPGQALVTINADDHAWIGAIRGELKSAPTLKFIGGLEARRVTVKVLFDSYDPLIKQNPTFIADAPQTSPWSENHWIAQAGVQWIPLPRWNVALHFNHYQIARSGYIPKPTGPTDVEYKSANQLDGYLFWNPTHSLTLYTHARVSDRFMLGEMPLLYNSRTNQQFNKPFGLVSVGASYAF